MTGYGIVITKHGDRFEGRYEIAYSASQFRRAGKGDADLLVRAYAPDGTELAAAPILCPRLPQ